MISTFAFVFRVILSALVAWRLVRLLAALRDWRSGLRQAYFTAPARRRCDRSGLSRATTDRVTTSRETLTA